MGFWLGNWYTLVIVPPTCGCRGMLGVVVLGNSILYTLPVTSSALYTCIVCNISITWKLSWGVSYTVVHPSAHLGPKLSVCGWPPRDMNCISDRGGSYFDLYPAKNHWIIHIMVHWCQSQYGGHYSPGTGCYPLWVLNGRSRGCDYVDRPFRTLGKLGNNWWNYDRLELTLLWCHPSPRSDTVNGYNYIIPKIVHLPPRRSLSAQVMLSYIHCMTRIFHVQ